MNTGDRIKEFIENKNLSIKEFADRIDMSYENLHAYTTNRRRPGLKVLERLFDEGCDLNWLITGKKINSDSVLNKKIQEIERLFKRFGINSLKLLEHKLQSLDEIDKIINK